MVALCVNQCYIKMNLKIKEILIENLFLILKISKKDNKDTKK